LGADRVTTKVIGARIATTITKKARERIEAAGFKRRPEYVFGLERCHTPQCSVLSIKSPAD
jgi:hypothetical protein